MSAVPLSGDGSQFQLTCHALDLCHQVTESLARALGASLVHYSKKGSLKVCKTIE